MKFRTQLTALEQRCGANSPPPTIIAALIEGGQVIKVFQGGQSYFGSGLTLAGFSE
jgi:hypothetical protein